MKYFQVAIDDLEKLNMDKSGLLSFNELRKDKAVFKRLGFTDDHRCIILMPRNLKALDLALLNGFKELSLPQDKIIKLNRLGKKSLHGLLRMLSTDNPEINTYSDVLIESYQRIIHARQRTKDKVDLPEWVVKEFSKFSDSQLKTMILQFNLMKLSTVDQIKFIHSKD